MNNSSFTKASTVKSDRVLLVQPCLLPYRWGVFERVIKQAPADVMFLQLGIPDESRMPDLILERVCNDRSCSPVRVAGIRWDILAEFLRVKPDVLLIAPTPETATQILMVLWQKLKGCKVIMWHKGESPLREKKSFRNDFVDRAMGIAGKFMDAFVVYGKDARRYFQELGVSDQRIFVAQNTVDTSQIIEKEKEIIRKAVELKNSLFSNKKRVILILCTLKPSKKVELALAAFRRLSKKRSDLSLVIVGDGPQRAALEKIAIDSGINDCHFAGRVPLFEDNYYIAAADIFLVPGGGGLAINQAMLLGIPVICADEPGADTELVREGETGFRVPRGDVEAMVNRCELLLDNQGIADRISAKAKEVIVNEGSVDRMAKGMLDALAYCRDASKG